MREVEDHEATTGPRTRGKQNKRKQPEPDPEEDGEVSFTLKPYYSNPVSQRCKYSTTFSILCLKCGILNWSDGVCRG